MLDRDDLTRWARVFAAADEQVRRDHLLSHVLAVLSEMADPDHDLVFYGHSATRSSGSGRRQSKSAPSSR